MDNKTITLVDYMKNIDGKNSLRESFYDYFFHHQSGLPTNTNECEAVLKEGLNVFFDVICSKKYSPPDNCVPGPLVAKVMGEAKYGSLREVLKNAILKTPLSSLPSDNNQYRRILEQAIETYKIFQ
jgi:hypothetical protein